MSTISRSTDRWRSPHRRTDASRAVLGPAIVGRELGEDAAQVCAGSAPCRRDRRHDAAAAHDGERLAAVLDRVEQVGEALGCLGRTDLAHESDYPIREPEVQVPLGCLRAGGPTRCSTSSRPRPGSRGRRRPDRRLGEDGAGGGGGFGEDALGLGAEAAVEEFDDFEDGDLAGVAGEAVAALHAALGAQDAGAAEDGEELLEELDRDVAAARELADRAPGRRRRSGRAQRARGSRTATWS